MLELSNEEFSELVESFSEPSGLGRIGSWPVSNEAATMQNCVRNAFQNAGTGGAYLGIGPEQNFSFIAALKPEVAFVVDLRTHVFTLLLAYKALFETCVDRAEFVSRLVSRRRPDGLTAESSAADLMVAFRSVEPDAELYKETIEAITEFCRERSLDLDKQIILLYDRRGRSLQFPPQPLLREFFEFGVDIRHWNQQPWTPSFADISVSTDSDGHNWHFLNDESSYQHVRQLHQKNLIIPILGKMQGPAVPKIGEWLRAHAIPIKTAYLSNSIEYVRDDFPAFTENLAGLPWATPHALIDIHMGRAPDAFKRGENVLFVEPWQQIISREEQRYQAVLQRWATNPPRMDLRPQIGGKPADAIKLQEE